MLAPLPPVGCLVRWAVLVAVVLPLCFLGACTWRQPTVRSVSVLPSAPSAGTLAAQLAVTGAGGPLNRRQREALIRRAGAQGEAGLLPRQLAAMTAISPVELFAGNDVGLLIDGPATFQAMFDALEQARDSILLQSYIVDRSDIATRLAEVLARKRAQGVAVLLLYDGLGSAGADPAYFERLRAAGVATCAFNPLDPLQRPGYWGISHRDHRKILSIDRQVGFTGGVNISAVYSAGSFRRTTRGPRGLPDQGWRDTHVRLAGPAVAALDDIVRSTWQQQGCEGALPAWQERALPAVAGRQMVRIIPSSPNEAVNAIYDQLVSSIDVAQRSVHLTMAYFAPGDDMIEALRDAAGRGVDVQLVLPSLSDFAPVLHAGRSHYTRLLQAGVVIHELQDAVLHAKTAVVDGVVSTVGSSNLDWRSIASNNEVNAIVLGEDFGDAMERMFHQDVRASKTITLADWQQRPLLQRTKETLARLFDRWW
jgi:cardiolipin synthase A/B